MGLQVIGLTIFTQGFLLSRSVPDVISDQVSLPPRYDKAIVLIIDALRFDFTIPVPDSAEWYHNSLPILHELHQTEQGLLLKFIADPPTTTLQRLKGLTTGSLPTFIDAGSNFNGEAIDEDNWVLQAQRRGMRTAFMGDDTWQALFSLYFNQSFPYPSLNVWDFHTVDDGVAHHLFPLLEHQSSWDILIGHFLGVDHIGHRYGPSHRSIRDKLHQMNEYIERVVAKMDDKTLLVVMGDHGMDSTGNHGGDSKDELEASLFLYGKLKKSIKKLLPEAYDISGAGANYRSVNQIDLVPTISLLLGLPIPHNNLGFPIEEMFGGLADAAFETASQIEQFRRSSGHLKLMENQALEDLFNAVESAKSSRKLALEIIQLAQQFQMSHLDQCKQLWARFDVRFIIIGILLLLASFTIILTYSRSIPSVRISTMSFEFLGSIIAMSLLGLVASLSIYIVLLPNISLKNCLAIGIATSMIVGFWAPIMDRFSIDWLFHLIVDFFVYNFNGWSFLGLSFLIMHSVIFASNSFVIWEDKMVDVFISTFGVLAVIAVVVLKMELEKKIIAGVNAITFVIVTRLIGMVNLCREEQGGYCRPTFHTTWWSVGLLYVIAYMLPALIRSFYRNTNSFHSAGPLWITTGLRFLLALNAVYWTLDYVENNYGHLINEAIVVSCKLGLARTVQAVAVILANYAWSRGPLCVRIDVKPSQEAEPEKVPVILGYENIYGSSYFLLVLNIAVAVMLTSKPLAALAIAGLLVQILCFVELVAALDLRRNLVCPILIGLLGYQHFFSTGHQATIPSIQWDAAFITTETIVIPFTHLNLFLNNFGSFLVICLAAPLVTLWRIPPTPKPIAVLSQVITVVTSLITYQTLLTLSSLIFTAHFRRHLMVWKIFAPRFMMNGVVLLVMDVVLVVITLGFGVQKVLTQVNRIFQ